MSRGNTRFDYLQSVRERQQQQQQQGTSSASRRCQHLQRLRAQPPEQQQQAAARSTAAATAARAARSTSAATARCQQQRQPQHHDLQTLRRLRSSSTPSSGSTASTLHGHDGGSRSKYLEHVQRRQQQSLVSSAEASEHVIQIVVSHTTVRDAEAAFAAKLDRRQAAHRKRPRYDNTRRAAKAKARATAHPPKISLESRRGNPDRIRALLRREVCDCSREICYRQLRADVEDVIALVQEFARLPKAARDGLVCRGSDDQIICIFAGKHMGVRCFGRILIMHHGNVYKKGARVDLRLRGWMSPRRCPMARHSTKQATMCVPGRHACGHAYIYDLQHGERSRSSDHMCVRRSIRYRRHCRHFLLRLYFDMGETLPNKFHGLRHTDEPVDSDVEGDEDIGRLEVRSAQHSKHRSPSSSSRRGSVVVVAVVVSRHHLSPPYTGRSHCEE